ncbi:MAG: DUF4926 domain-containing protein [Tychonema bourrellyi B0820]|uniref:DUF4926 domain-containing protein n=1 Tax=Tychonema bourrellyi TaxID=54313 RepID=UPI001FE3206B|nr:DUF4926 domain-containing protein [Tychonema bourrellyi]MDQ2100770.1 DUF4926 domain-containing protein [Tychonema bourrellyi B0820]
MNYQLYSDVILLCNLPEEGLDGGDIGTVVEQHHVEGLETGYSVEFFDLSGNTIKDASKNSCSIKAIENEHGGI